LRGSVGIRVRTLLMARGVLGERATDFYIAFWIIFAIGVGLATKVSCGGPAGPPICRVGYPMREAPKSGAAASRVFDEALAARTRQRTGRPDPSARPVRSRLLS
jgi:hypothetical protein